MTEPPEIRMPAQLREAAGQAATLLNLSAEADLEHAARLIERLLEAKRENQYE